MLTVTNKNSYRKGGSIVFVYFVDSNETDAAKKKADLDAYVKTAGDKLVKEGERMLFFSQDIVANGTELAINRAGTSAYLKTDLTDAADAIKAETTKALGKLNAVAQALGIPRKQAAMMLLQAA